MNLEKMLFRAWYYFRQGYATYLAFLIGFVSNIIVIYSLGIKPVIDSNRLQPTTLGSFFQTIFPHLTNFVIIAAVIITPICIYLGLLHMKGTGAFAADASVSTESNPYIYKVVPGKEEEIYIPFMLLAAQGIAKILERQNDITPSEKKQFEEVIAKASSVLAGQPVGVREQPNLIPRLKRKE